jgi:hypothetical protein
MKVALLLVSAALLSARPARADQCEWLDDASIARRAARELASHPEFVAFCEPCGDAAPGVPQRANKVSVRNVQDHTEVEIDGETVDLAYIYLRTSDRQYRNLAMLAGCATTGVSPRLRVDSATPAGVLIRADRVAAPPAPPVAAPVQEAPVASAPAPERATIVFVESHDTGRGWLVYVALAAGFGALAAWRIARRRQSHVPRASRLTPRS